LTPPVPPAVRAARSGAREVDGRSVPSFFAPSLTVMRTAGRLPKARIVSSRVMNSLTGRAVCFASSAAMMPYLPVSSLLPKPPPM
jgi:hypothetical protein